MKTLVVGLDGVSHAFFERGWMPKMAGFVRSGRSLDIHEDLISRGWSEIFLGQKAAATGAYYEAPQADQTYGWSERFRLADVPGLGTSTKPIWQVANDLGYRVGVLNMPTTFPAQKVDGFFVSGGGGGGPLSRDPSEAQCYPPSLAQSLKGEGYIVDERLPSLLGELGLYEPSAFFERLATMECNRARSFERLCREYSVDLGIEVVRATVTMETFAQAELAKAESADGTANQGFLECARGFCLDLDLALAQQIESLAPSQIVLVSDHGMGVRSHAVNPNAALVSIGRQRRLSRRQARYEALHRFKRLVPGGVKRQLGHRTSIAGRINSMVSFDTTKTEAFCHTLSNGRHGIYINDSLRFGGPVDPRQREQRALEIVEELNALPQSIEHDIHARLYATRGGAPMSHLAPDIYLAMPPGYHTTTRFGDHVTSTPLPLGEWTLRDTARDDRTVAKESNALAVLVGGSWLCDSGANELTAVYQHLERTFDRPPGDRGQTQ